MFSVLEAEWQADWANWLYAKLKGRSAKLRIEEQEVQLEEGEIKNVISRVIEKRG
ncbi:MAG: hypothetical protein ACREV9_07030 [Burkholderiales bacterium]